MMPRFASTGESASVNGSHAIWLPEDPVQARDINDLCSCAHEGAHALNQSAAQPALLHPS